MCVCVCVVCATVCVCVVCATVCVCVVCATVCVCVCVTVVEWLEHWTHNLRVGSSNPTVTTGDYLFFFIISYLV